jgi:hypothetical protein
VYLLENFANSTAPLLPILGQLWYNSNTDSISAYSSANTWTALASQVYVQAQKVSPAFSGVPTAPTAANGTSNTQLATTAFVLNQLQSADSIAVSGNITGGNIRTGGTVSATGNVSGNTISGNLITGGVISSGGNITGGNVLTSGVVSATGNVIGANFVGNVISPAGSNVNTTGNITGGNIFATGNITAANTLTVDVVIANTVITTGTTSAFKLPNLTQTQINALSASNGDMVYNTTDDLPQIYQNGAWKNFTISYYS